MRTAISRKGLIFALCVGSAAVLLSGCSGESKRLTYRAVPGEPTVKQIRYIAGKALAAEKIRIIHLGQTVRLIVPIDYFFNPGSANLMKSKQFVWNDVVRYIKTYNKAEVNVEGYTSNRFSAPVATALTQKQAAKVANIFWRKGINTQLVVAKGLGMKNKVASNYKASGRFKNNRIEITFMYRVKNLPYN